MGRGYLGAPKGGPLPLAALTDVTLTSPQEGDLLEYTSGKWRNAAGALVKVLSAAWSPADVTMDEIAALLTVPANAVVIAATTEVATPTDAGSSPALIVRDAQGECYSGSFPLAADSSEATIGVDDTWIGKTPVTFFVPTAFSAHYTAGVTPGATTPVVEVYFWILAVP